MLRSNGTEAESRGAAPFINPASTSLKVLTSPRTATLAARLEKRCTLAQASPWDVVCCSSRNQISSWPADTSTQACACTTSDSIPSQICFPSCVPFLGKWHHDQECSQKHGTQELNAGNSTHVHQQEKDSTDCDVFMPGNIIQQWDYNSSSCSHHMEESETHYAACKKQVSESCRLCDAI